MAGRRTKRQLCASISSSGVTYNAKQQFLSSIAKQNRAAVWGWTFHECRHSSKACSLAEIFEPHNRNVNTIDWNNPDHWLAALLLPGNDQVYGKIKNGFGLLEGIPTPKTKLFFNDIVKVTGPIGTQKFRDDDIKEYKVEHLAVRSAYKTFSFKAQLPDYKAFFALGDLFQEQGLKVRISWIDDKRPLEWKDCLCAAKTKDKAEELLKKFLKQNKKAHVKDLVEFNQND